MLAADAGRADLCSALLGARADPFAKNNDLCDAIGYAMKRYVSALSEEEQLRHSATVQVLDRALAPPPENAAVEEQLRLRRRRKRHVVYAQTDVISIQWLVDENLPEVL